MKKFWYNLDYRTRWFVTTLWVLYFGTLSLQLMIFCSRGILYLWTLMAFVVIAVTVFFIVEDESVSGF